MVTSRYLPVQQKSPLKAIREMCLECMGGREVEGVRVLIKECASVPCALYRFRFGRNPHNKRKLSDEQKSKAVKQLSKWRRRQVTNGYLKEAL